MRLVVLVSIAAILAASGCLAYRTPGYLSFYEDQTPMLVGNLTWKSGAGGISWTPDPSSEDPGGGTDATAGFRATLGWYQRQYTGSDGGNIPRITFTSQPVAKLVYLNVSRFIELDVYLLSAECARGAHYIEYDVEVYVGDRFLAGQTRGVFEDDYYNTRPLYVDGHCAHYARMHPEIDRLLPGEVVRIEFLLFGQVSAFQFGTQGDHASVIRFPHYTPEDAAERVLDAAPRTGAASPEAEPSAAAAPKAPDPSPLLPIGGMALLGLRRRRSAPALAATLLLLGALSGCFGNEPGPSSASPSVSLDYEDPENASVPLAQGKGAIAGRVYDALDERIRLSRVHVSLLGTSNTTNTNADGEFLLKDLSPRQYTIRFDREEYVSRELAIEVREGRVTTLKVPMSVAVDRGAGFRPHSHDEWVGVEMPFLEQDVALDLYSAADAPVKSGVCANVYTITDDWCYKPFFPKDDRLVRPGTRELEVRINWDPSANRVERVGLTFSDNRAWHYNQTFLYPRARDVPFRIQVGWEMGDVGHQLFSTWGFELLVPTNGGSYTTPLVTANQLVTQPFHVTMKIRKGMIPLEPAHRDFWGLNDTYALGSLPANYITSYIGGNRDGHVYDHEATWDYIEKLVPPETRWLDVILDQGKTPTRPNPQAPLYYKPANIPPGVAATPGYVWGKALPTSANGARLTYKIPVGEKESDAFYQSRSNWQFYFNQDVTESSNVIDGTSERLIIVAHRDPLT